jgi:adenine/guanine phosphoribosyltransferase-like PRPP-binding protein
MVGETEIHSSKHIKTGIAQLYYPIGEKIHENKDRIEKLIKEFASIKEFNKQKLTLICRGSSGAIIAAMFAMKLSNECVIIHIKKDGEESHTHFERSRVDRNSKLIIVDDFVKTGNTVNTIYHKLTEIFNPTTIVIDCLCVTGTSKRLNFEPKYFISS